MTDFLPILNFDFGETPVLSVEDEYYFYEKALDVLDKSFNEIEISFVSDAFVFNAKKILRHVEKLDLRLSFGSIYEPEQISELVRLLKASSFIQPEIKIFSPVFQQNIYEALHVNKDFNFKYVPGFFTKAQLKQNQKFLDSCDAVKIFPFNVTSAKSLYLKLCKPYPELRKHICVPKVLFASKELVEKYNIFENVKKDDNGSEFINAKSGDQVFIIKSPLDYQKVRSKFLFNPRVKIFFDFEDKLDDKDVLELAQNKKVFLTGIKQKDLSQELLESDALVIATNVFSNTLKDHLSGAVKTEDLGLSFEEELGITVKGKPL
jgi:2-keto-3-deoxy-6-phosphogluconate aldolase